jgi:hypothetical protein
MTGQKVEDLRGGNDPALAPRAMDERPKYRALARLVLEPGWREIAAGALFEHDGPATSGMMPVNGAARRAKLRSIDRHWRDVRPQQIHRLARSLGWAGGTDAEAAAHIEAFIKTETQKEPKP